jgi:hypothetical protein
VALSQARILYQNHSGDYPQVILTIPVTCRTPILVLRQKGSITQRLCHLT